MDLAARILDRLRQSPFSVEELAFDRKPSVSRILLANVCRERARARCCSRDGGGPSEVGLQEQASHSRKLRWSRAIVVNVTEKA
jgi:hypothetical protein